MKYHQPFHTGIVLASLILMMSVVNSATGEPADGSWQTIDRVIASIESEPVLLSDVIIEIDLSLLTLPDGATDLKALLNLYLNRLLIIREVEEVGEFRLTNHQKEGSYRGYLTQYTDNTAYIDKLESWGISEQEVKSRLNRALLASLYTESRIKFFIRVLPFDIEEAYEQYPERWGDKGLYEVWNQIKKELSEEAFERERDRWMGTLRTRYKVEIMNAENDVGIP